jgi:hypothetical protein
MPTSSGARSSASVPVTRSRALAAPVPAEAVPELLPVASSTMTPAVSVMHQGIVVPPNVPALYSEQEAQPRLSSLPPMASPNTVFSPVQELYDRIAPSQTSPAAQADYSQENPIHQLAALVTELSLKVDSLNQEVLTLKAAASSSEEVIEGLRSTIQDLEEMVLRELVADPPKEKVMSKKKIVSTTFTPFQGDDLNRLSRPQRNPSPDGDTSENEDTSSEEEGPKPEPRGARVPGLKEQVTRRPEFKSLVSYRSYRLGDTDQRVNASLTGKVNAHLKRLKHYLDYKYSGDPAIQVLDFLRTFKEAADLNGISEGVAVIILPYFLEGRAKSGLASRLKQVPSSVPRYPAAVQWLLQSFATEAVIAAAYQKVFTAKQKPEEDETAYAGRLTKNAAEAGSVFTEDALISAFVDGLLPYASNMVRGRVTTTMTFAEVQILAEQVGEAGRALSTMSRATIRVGTPGVIPIRPRVSSALSVSTDISPDSGDPLRAARSMLVATADMNPHGYGPPWGGGQDTSRSVMSDTTSMSAPTRGWASMAGSLQEEEALAMEVRNRNCHICFNPGHFLMECPLMDEATRSAIQQHRAQRFNSSPRTENPTIGGIPPRVTPAVAAMNPTGLLTRPANSPRYIGGPRYGDTRRPPMGVNHVEEELTVAETSREVYESPSQGSENSRGEA